MDELTRIQSNPLPFSKLLGVKFLGASPERLTAELLVRKELCTNPEVLQGGAIMALANTLGAYATLVNLKDGQGTTTIESKTNFLAPAPVGTTVRAGCTAIHRGRRTMVWQTRGTTTDGRLLAIVTTTDGRLLAIVTQTQMVLESKSVARGTTDEQAGHVAQTGHGCALHRILAPRADGLARTARIDRCRTLSSVG
jgi:uncharacterized protein (TIGR00369 family)